MPAERPHPEAQAADVEEIELEEGPSAESPAWRRIRAGILVEGGRISPQDAASWQAEARQRDFDADACANELLAGGEDADDLRLIEARSRSLLRELLMRPLARAQSGGGSSRAVRSTKRGLAMLVAQLYMLVIWAGLTLTAALLLRMDGFEFDGLLDRLLSVFQ